MIETTGAFRPFLGILLVLVAAAAPTVLLMRDASSSPSAADPGFTPASALTRTTYAVEHVEAWVTAPNGNQLYTRIVQPDPALYLGQRFPAVILVPGGLGAGAPLAGSPLYGDLAASGFVVVAFNAEGRGSGLSGNLQSEGTEDCNGFVHQDDLKAIIEYTAALPNVDVTNIGVHTSSYGITMGAGALGRYPELPVAYLIDGEGPHDNRVTTHYDVGSEHDMCGHWSLVTDPSPENEAWWAEREAIRYVGSYPGRYLRMQAEVDHAQGAGYFRHAIEMVNAATKAEYGGSGSALWTRMNGSDLGNAVNVAYPLEDPSQYPTWISGRLSDHPGLNVAYVREMAALAADDFTAAVGGSAELADSSDSSSPNYAVLAGAIAAAAVALTAGAWYASRRWGG